MNTKLIQQDPGTNGEEKGAEGDSGRVLTKKGEVGGRVTDELDERFPHGLPDHAVRRDDVRGAVEGEKDADPHDIHRLQDHVFPPETRQALVPNRCE